MLPVVCSQTRFGELSFFAVLAVFGGPDEFVLFWSQLEFCSDIGFLVLQFFEFFDGDVEFSMFGF